MMAWARMLSARGGQWDIQKDTKAFILGSSGFGPDTWPGLDALVSRGTGSLYCALIVYFFYYYFLLYYCIIIPILQRED